MPCCIARTGENTTPGWPGKYYFEVLHLRQVKSAIIKRVCANSPTAPAAHVTEKLYTHEAE